MNGYRLSVTTWGRTVGNKTRLSDRSFFVGIQTWGTFSIQNSQIWWPIGKAWGVRGIETLKFPNELRGTLLSSYYLHKNKHSSWNIPAVHLNSRSSAFSSLLSFGSLSFQSGGPFICCFSVLLAHFPRMHLTILIKVIISLFKLNKCLI